VDADGDEIMTTPVDDLPDLSEEGLHAVRLRRREHAFLFYVVITSPTNFLVVRTHILSGRIEDATAALQEHFPGVLSEDQAPPEPTPRPGKVDYQSATSVQARHIVLNLQVQSFIEATRTQPMPYVPRSATAAAKAPEIPVVSPENTARDGVDEAMDEHLKSLLHRVHKLYAVAQTLPVADDRAIYLQELGNISGLLAYKVPEIGPLSKYLSMERREAVATQVDCAILRKDPLSTVCCSSLC
jgi:hypothetical protein